MLEKPPPQSQTKPAAEIPEVTPIAAIEAITKLQTASLGSMNWLGSAWMTQMTEIHSEVLDFVSERIREDIKTQHEILHCKTADELRDVQARFVKTAMEQYSAETGRLIKLGTDLMEDALKPS